jgi:biotin carboxyl carrier protein
MAFEVNIGQRTAKVEILNRAGSKVLLSIDGHKYDIDIVMVEKGVYSILYKGHSYNVELIEGDASKRYVVNTFWKSFVLDIVDAESKYIQSRNKGLELEGENSVSSPMPGKVIKIPVKVGDMVEPGQTLVIVEAMKMQSEFKASHEKKVVDILVKEGDTVNAHQLMMRLE